MEPIESNPRQPQTPDESVTGQSTAVVSPPRSESQAELDLPSARPSSGHQKPWRWLFRGVALGLTAAVSAGVGLMFALVVPLPSAIAPKDEAGETKPVSFGDILHRGSRYQVTRPINILVMGVDLPMDLPEGTTAHVFAGRTDTMMLVRLDPETQSVNILSIPRDTQVSIPEEGVTKINHANVLGGPELAARVVSSNLNGITVDRYVRVSTGAFRELVDLMGGVEVYVPEPMHYEDVTQKLKIDLEPGTQTLNGAQAEQFARFRADENGDIGRVQRQQQLIRALQEKLMNPVMLTRIPQAVALFQKYIDTNLTSDEMLALADFGLGLKRDNFRMVMLPGRFSTPEEFEASYWIMDPTARDQVLSQYFDVSSVAVLSQTQQVPTQLRIAVQNASSDPQIGEEVVTYLQDKGYTDVYVVQDWPDPQKQTQIIAQRGDLQSATTLEGVLGMGQVVPASTGDIESDLTIRVGEDWAQRRSQI